MREFSRVWRGVNWRPLAVCFALALPLWAVAGYVSAEGGTVDTQARRLDNAVQVTPTIPQPSTREIVNSLPYQHYADAPAMQAFRMVAAERGWSPASIKAWEPMVHDIMMGESAFCWNRRRGDVVRSYSMGCVITRQGTHEDVGYGQVTSSFYGSDGLLCTQYGVCSRQQILASPYDSMLWSIVIPIELDGSHPWCWSSAARSYHPTCASAPD